MYQHKDPHFICFKDHCASILEFLKSTLLDGQSKFKDGQLTFLQSVIASWLTY
jgi:hypothetical protein